jgi:protein phosphatase
VASELAVREFEGGLPDGRDPADALVERIRAANATIHDQARTEAEHAGMGTTVTAAYVAGDTVVVAHVGDSRAYLLRGGDLTRLTRDHSLVDELVRRGKLTVEQAEAHPQRSVITRALGPEPDVEVDIEAFPARAGDVFLLCSDGLTAMVHEPQLKPLLEQPGASLRDIGRALIAAANEAGGRDNITVILFRLEEVEDRRAGARSDSQATAEYDVEAVGGAQPTAVHASDAAEADYRRSGTVAVQAPPREDAAAARESPPRTAPARPRRRKQRRGRGTALLALAIVLPLLIAGWLATRAVYFVGTDAGRAVTIYRGLPYELPLGVHLYEHYYTSGVTLPQIAPARRATFTDHRLRSRDDAENLVNALEKGQLE